MKIILTVLALIIFQSGMAQNKPPQDTIKQSVGKLTTGSFKFDTKAYSGSILAVNPPKQSYYFIARKNITVITISPPDSTGLYKVWFDKKEVTFTSDSTFTFKIPQK